MRNGIVNIRTGLKVSELAQAKVSKRHIRVVTCNQKHLLT